MSTFSRVDTPLRPSFRQQQQQLHQHRQQQRHHHQRHAYHHHHHHHHQHHHQHHPHDDNPVDTRVFSPIPNAMAISNGTVIPVSAIARPTPIAPKTCPCPCIACHCICKNHPTARTCSNHSARNAHLFTPPSSSSTLSSRPSSSPPSPRVQHTPSITPIASTKSNYLSTFLSPSSSSPPPPPSLQHILHHSATNVPIYFNHFHHNPSSIPIAHTPFTIMSQPVLPVPLRNITTILPDGSLVYYTARQTFPCLPLRAKSLTRQTLPPPTDPSSPMLPLTLNTPLHQKPVLIIANPAAGTAAPATHSQTIATLTTILSDAGLRPQIRITARPRHATALLADLHASLHQFAAVLAVGGDGTLQEVLNGLIAASTTAPSSTSTVSSTTSAAVVGDIPKGSINSSSTHRLPPLAVIPAGSGNAIAVSLHLPTVAHAALNVVHSLRQGLARPVAVLQYRRLSAPQRERLVIGGIQWGLPAEVDQRTEKLRFLGDFRFDLGAFYHVLAGATFRARIKVTVDPVKQADAWCRVEALRREAGAPLVDGCVTRVDENVYVLNGAFYLAVAWNSRSIADGFSLTPLARVTELGVFDLMVLPADGLSRLELFKLLLRADGGFMSVSDRFKYFKAKRVVFERIEGNHLTVDGEPVPVEPFVLDVAPEDGKVDMLDAFSENE